MDYKEIIRSALLASALFITGLFIPLLGQAVALFTPVPLMLAYAGKGRREGVAATVGSAAIAAAIVGWQAAAVMLLGFGLMAAGTAEGMRREMRPERAVLIGGIIPVVLAGIVFTYYSLHFQKNPVFALEQYLKNGITDAAALYSKLGLGDAAELITAAADRFIYYFVRLIPAIAVAIATVQAACCYGLTRVILIRRQGAASGTVPALFSVWHAPDTWVWGLILALGLTALPVGEAGKIAGWNLTLLYSVVYTIQGLAVLEFYLRKIGIPAAARGLLFALILSMPVFALVTALGVVDIWADFRKARTGRAKEK